MGHKTMWVTIALLLVVSVTHPQTIRLNAGVKGVHVMYEDLGWTGFIFWEGEPLMMGVSLAIREQSDTYSLPLVWNNRRWYTFLHFELERLQERADSGQQTNKVWVPVLQTVKFRVARELILRNRPEGGWEKVPQSPTMLNPFKGHRSVSVEVQLLPQSGDLKEGVYQGRVIFDGQQTSIGQQLVSPWFAFEVRVVKDMRDRLASLAHLGYRRLFVGDLNGAEKAFKQILALYPESIGGYRGLGEVYFERGDYSKAEQMFEKARELLLKKQDQYAIPLTYKSQRLISFLTMRIEWCHTMRGK